MRIVLLSLAALTACATTPAAPVDQRPVQRFGAAITSQRTALPIASVLEQPDDRAGRTVIVEGKVRSACTRKGCWMELARSGEKGTPGCRVTFKDYGFFVPTNSAGAEARVEGTLVVRNVPPDEVAHMESEGGSFSAKQPDGSAREVRIVATGVELRR
jgi:hypothetical protein